jgi:hypothetical protein
MDKNSLNQELTGNGRRIIAQGGEKNCISGGRGYAVGNSFAHSEAMMDKRAIRPSGWFYMIGIALVLAGFCVFGYSLFNGIFHIADNLTRMAAPGEKDLTLKGNLKYAIFAEEQSSAATGIYSMRSIGAGLTCHIREEASGREIETQRPIAAATYNVGSRVGRALFVFDTEDAGVYHLSCGYAEGSQRAGVTVAVGSGVEEEMGKAVLTGLAAMFGGGILGAIVLVTVYLMREKAKRRLALHAPLPLG